MMVKRRMLSHGHSPLYQYLYLIGAYSKFLTVGKCLNFPRILHIQTQSFCNGRCSICPYPIVSKKLDQGTMEWSLFAKLADETASEPLLSTVLFELHNEPLLDERIFDWVKYLKSISPDKSCVIVTNGELLDSFSAPRFSVSGNFNRGVGWGLCSYPIPVEFYRNFGLRFAHLRSFFR